MQYLGGKSRYAKDIVRCLTSNSLEIIDATVYEPFVGGANITEYLCKHFTKTVASDLKYDLILLYNALLDGWVPPDSVSLEEYESLRNAEPSALRSFVGFGCSFGGMFFSTYAKNKRGDDYAKQTGNVLRRQFSVFKNHDISFLHRSYENITPQSGDYVYCDPPYINTAGYTTGTFDHYKFYEKCEEWVDKGVKVFVSEYTMPDDWVSVWEKPVKLSLQGGGNGRERIEKLFVHQKQFSSRVAQSSNVAWMESLF